MNPRRERLLDLLADRSLVGLALPEEGELAQLYPESPDADTALRELERAAAAVTLATLPSAREPMPAALAARLLAEGEREATAAAFESAPETLLMRSVPPAPAIPGGPRAGGPPPPVALGTAPTVPAAWPPPPAPARPITPGRGARVAAITGWLVAAACLALAVSVWYLRPRTRIVTVNAPAPSLAPTAPSPREAREALLARAGTARFEWSKNAKDPASTRASGDVVWNAAEQQGFMRFNGLAKNDRAASEYQLWIFDKTRDGEYPVDGGVFSIDEDGDVVVPIHARLPVGEVALFAVTVERPGGVVVSKRERIVVTAKPAG